jgi:hypothetical protein
MLVFSVSVFLLGVPSNQPATNQLTNQQKSLGAYIGGVHLFPFRTEKLSPPEPMVLP